MNKNKKASPTPEQLNEILDRIDYWIEKDDKLQELCNTVCATISPSCYPLLLEPSCVFVYIDAISTVYPDLKDHLGYYAWELPNMKNAGGTANGMEYNLKDREEFIAFVLAE